MHNQLRYTLGRNRIQPLQRHNVLLLGSKKENLNSCPGGALCHYQVFLLPNILDLTRRRLYDKLLSARKEEHETLGQWASGIRVEKA